MDTLLDGAMRDALARGSYPDQPKRCRVFVNKRVNAENPLQLPRPPAVIVVGLGDEGTLEGKDLAASVCQGVIEWASERPEPRAAPFAMAAVLVGSGGSTIGVGQSALMVVQGFVDANAWLAKKSRAGVSRLSLVELYLDRASEAWCALNDRMAASAAGFQVDPHIELGAGALPCPIDVSYRGDSYDWISAAPEGQDERYAISYTVSTKRARTEVRAKTAQVKLLRQLVKREDDPALGRTLFRLLVPADVQAFLTTSSHTLIELDSRTAALPWELLDAGDASEPLPWAICSKVIRKLRTKEIGERRLAGADAHALVIGEPQCDEQRYPRLPSATAEANAVANILERSPVFGPSRVRRLLRTDPSGPGPTDVVTTLVGQDWRVVHIAGHGELPEWLAGEDPAQKRPSGEGNPRGVVLSDGTFLGQHEFEGLNKMPELVFVNCCHLAAQGSDHLLGTDDPSGVRAHDRVRFAASLAESLIALGVRCVVAAGWAVEDEPARVFATTFYENLARSVRFMDAVARAREEARKKGGNTWAAYQCYGDPDWRLERRDRGAGGADAPAETYAQVASGPALEVALKTAAVNARYDAAAREALPAAIEHLEARFASRWGGVGSVAEAFATAWAECDRGRAMGWYRRALEANDGTASIRAAEQLGNLRARVALASIGPGAPDGEAPGAELARARGEIAGAIELLEGLARIQTSIERESLCGSAWKRMAMLEALAGEGEREREAIEHMRDRYRRAEGLARGSNHPDLFYPALNGMAAELIVDAGKPGWPGFDPERAGAVRASLEAKMRDDPDFWSAAGQIELLVYESIARGGLAARRPAIEREYSDLKSRVTSGWQWSSVRDQLSFVLSRSPALSAEDRKAAQGLLGLLEEFAR